MEGKIFYNWWEIEKERRNRSVMITKQIGRESEKEMKSNGLERQRNEREI